MNTQPEITKNWLYERGYTISAAARVLKRSHHHISQVLQGNRESAQVISLLLNLPPRSLVLRERISPSHK